MQVRILPDATSLSSTQNNALRTDMNPEIDLIRVGFKRGYTLTGGTWVKCYIPPNSIGKTRIPHRFVNGIKTTLGKEEYDRLPFQFNCND